MNGFARKFRDAAHSAGEACDLPNGRVVREFGLKDFLENVIAQEDDVATVCVRAAKHFCEEADPKNPCFRFGVLAITLFLHSHHRGRATNLPTMAMRDLVKTLIDSGTESAIRSWIVSHFG